MDSFKQLSEGLVEHCEIVVDTKESTQRKDENEKEECEVGNPLLLLLALVIVTSPVGLGGADGDAEDDCE